MTTQSTDPLVIVIVAMSSPAPEQPPVTAMTTGLPDAPPDAATTNWSPYAALTGADVVTVMTWAGFVTVTSNGAETASL